MTRMRLLQRSVLSVRKVVSLDQCLWCVKKTWVECSSFCAHDREWVNGTVDQGMQVGSYQAQTRVTETKRYRVDGEKGYDEVVQSTVPSHMMTSKRGVDEGHDRANGRKQVDRPTP